APGIRFMFSFFFQAEDGIRVFHVTGVQTCALPIFYHEFLGRFGELLRLDKNNRVLGKHRIGDGRASIQPSLVVTSPDHAVAFLRSEERRVGKEGRWRGSQDACGSQLVSTLYMTT